LFSYTDTQLLRLSGPNFNEIPINRPRLMVCRCGASRWLLWNGHSGRLIGISLKFGPLRRNSWVSV
ncbi:catalase, partial [Pseudomonas aeruginosa]|nr:catalase [Pseudomonas aeruginosa]